MIFRLFTVVLFAVLPLIGKASAAEMILKVDISPEEKSILARGWTQQEIEQESAALLAYPEKPEKVSENAEYWKKRFFGSGVTVFSKCFRNYTEKYMEKFLSPEGILTGENPIEVYRILPTYNSDLVYIQEKKFPITHEIWQFTYDKSRIHGTAEFHIHFYLDKLLSEHSYMSEKFNRTIEEECFWLTIATAPFSLYGNYYEASGFVLDLINCFKYFHNKKNKQKIRTNAKTMCCTLL